MSIRLLPSLGALLAALSIGPPAAANTTWRGAPLGNWFDAAQWSSGVPTAASSGLVDVGFASIGASTCCEATASLLTVGGSFTGRTAGLGLQGNRLTLFEGLVLGRDSRSLGLITVGKGGALLTRLDVPLVIGQGGSGQLSISGGEVQVIGDVTLGQYVGSDGTLSIGNGAIRALDAVFVDLAPKGRGQLSLTSGGLLSMRTSELDIGRLGGQGTVSLDGPGALIDVDTVRVYTSATLNLRNGGLLRAIDLFAGAGSWQLGTDGRVEAFDTALAGDTRLQFSLGSSAAGLWSGGTLALAGTLEVGFDSAVTPQAGQRYDLLDWTSLSGRFDQLSLAALPDGLKWDTARLYVDGTVAVAAVPEPPSALGMLAGCLLLAARAGRRGCVSTSARA